MEGEDGLLAKHDVPKAQGSEADGDHEVQEGRALKPVHVAVLAPGEHLLQPGAPAVAVEGIARRIVGEDDCAPVARELARGHHGHADETGGWSKGVQFIWGCMDDVFPESWGRKWAARMHARFEDLPDAAHFPQITHGERIVELILDEPG
jgi:pimeloyl-ACP methyl ester carboxylesterase